VEDINKVKAKQVKTNLSSKHEFFENNAHEDLFELGKKDDQENEIDQNNSMIKIAHSKSLKDKKDNHVNLTIPRKYSNLMSIRSNREQAEFDNMTVVEVEEEFK